LGEKNWKNDVISLLAFYSITVFGSCQEHILGFQLKYFFTSFQALDVLVEEIQGTGFDDIAVILLGYEEPIRKMLITTNPGLLRRFPFKDTIIIPNFDDEQLLKIFQFNCKKRKYKIYSWGVEEKVLRVLQKQRVQPNFGNASAVEMVLEAAVVKAAFRCEDFIEIRLEDVDDGEDLDPDDGDPLECLNSMYKMNRIHTLLTELLNFLKVARAEGSATPEVGHFVFRGAPGTGKTTVGRLMARALFKLGFLASYHLEECSGNNLKLFQADLIKTCNHRFTQGEGTGCERCMT
jgi:hypothetical protein